MDKKYNISIMGTGAYGTVLANVLCDNGHNVSMYGVDEKQVNDIEVNKLNSIFFGNLKLNDSIHATTNIDDSIKDCEIIILAVPTFAIESVVNEILKVSSGKKVHFINIAKGLDGENLDLLSSKILNLLNKTPIFGGFSSLYGPSVAIECIERKPTCLMSCNPNMEEAVFIAKLFNNNYFSVHPTTDIVGCEIAAALKNTVAIASGIVHGLGGGDNSQASLITIGHNEIFKIAEKFGAKLETFMNFATLGDLILTATSKKSRNFSLGLEIAKSGNAKITLESYKTTVEGVQVCKIAFDMIKKFKISSPLFEMMYEILYNNKQANVLIDEIFKNKI